jgi:hypothetical protein
MRFLSPLAIALCVAVTPFVSAQAPGTGAISGTVRDPDNLPVKSAQVIVTEESTHSSRTVATQPQGEFTVSLLTPGTYTLTANAFGFAAAKFAAVKVTAGEITSVDVRLPTAIVTQTLDVNAEAIQLAQTETSTLGRAVQQHAVEALPLSSRNYTQILSLSPGVVVGLPDATQVGRGTQNIADDGNKPTANNLQFNGLDANNLAQNSARNANEEVGVAVPAPDTIQEFKVQTGNYDAGYGRGSGANVDLISRSGGNHVHGAVWEYVRNNLFNANLFFAKRDGEPRPTLKQNQFGGSISGPMAHRSFFFSAYQGTRSVNGVGGATTVLLPQLTSDRSAATLGAQFCPNAAGRTPDPFLTHAGGTQVACDGSNINPVALALLNSKLPNGKYAIPSPQLLLPTAPADLPVGQSTFAPSTYFNEDQYTVNLDHAFSTNDQVGARFFYAKAPTRSPFSPAGADVPGWGSNELDRNLMFVLSHTHIFHNQLVNVARAGFMRFDGALTVQHPIMAADVHTQSPTGLSGPGVPAPAVAIDGLFSIGDAGTPSQSQLTNSFIVQDLASVMRGSNSMRAGFELKRHQVMVAPLYSTSGYLDIRTFDDFLLGESAAQNHSPDGISNVTLSNGSSGIIRKDERYLDFATFLQNDFRITPSLTLNMGIRYEFFGAPVEAHGHLATFDTAVASTSAPASGTLSGYLVPANYSSAPPAGVQRTPYSGLWANTFHDVSPRFGFAWQLPGTTTGLVLRGGFGIYFQRVSANMVENLVTQPPFSTFVFAFDAANGGASLQAPFSPLLPPLSAYPLFPTRVPGGGITVEAISPHNTDPYTEEYNLNLQLPFARNYLLEVAYVGDRSLHQVGCNEFNQALLASPTHPINGETTNLASNVVARVPYQGILPGSLSCQTSYFGDYNGLQASVTRRLAHGLEFLASYTWSKALDELSGSGGSDVYEASLVTNDQFNPRQAYGPSDFDRSNRAVLSLVYNTNSVSSLPRFARVVAANWQISGIAVAQSGSPLTISDSTAGLVYGNFENRAAAPTSNPLTPGSLFHRTLPGNAYIDSSAFPSAPIAAFGTGASDTDFGNSSVGFLRGPAQRNIDLAVERAFPIHESNVLHLRVEFFNLTNTTQFANPDTNLSHGSSFGLIQGTSANPRIVQFAARYTF